VSRTIRVRLEPWSIEIDVPIASPLISVLDAHGIEFPCGGTGTCGGCGVRVLAGSLSITPQDESAFSATELADGWRLACQAHANVPLVLECGHARIDVLTDDARMLGADRHGLGIAIDVGTTTIAAQTIDLATGNILAVRTALNPQVRFGSDVMSRIRAALSGADLATPIRAALAHMIAERAGPRADEIIEVLLVGNTVMHHLFCGLDVSPLSHAPFESPQLSEQRFHPRDLGWPLPGTCSIRFARAIGGFVGSDILAGIVACGLANSHRLSALVDLGTNGEIAIGNRSGIVCASTAAGPAFEAGAIRMGMRAAPGAIAHVSRRDGQLRPTVIGNVDPRGICGSGLVDAVAAGLAGTAILPSGKVADGTRQFAVAGPVVLVQSDIRELQLAKAATASGFRLLLSGLGASHRDLTRIDLAGAFGNYIQIRSAIHIGLLDGPAALIHSAGNTALRGAKMMLLAGREPALPPIHHVSLAAIPAFQDEFAACMTFPSTTPRENLSVPAMSPE
jgi:uncharacterized 2Fe-2S/4Fe-4S cluster protein (DUF4445 family)